MLDRKRPDLERTAESHSSVVVISLVAKRLHWFTADDVWAVLDTALFRDDLRPSEPRALGGLLLEAKALGLIIPTGRYRASRRAVCKGRPVMVWKSRVYNRAAA